MYLSILKCPLTGNSLHSIGLSEMKEFCIDEHLLSLGIFEMGLIDASHSYLYPIAQDIIVLLPSYAIYVGNDEDKRETLAFDKKRVFDYYNQIILQWDVGNIAANKNIFFAFLSKIISYQQQGINGDIYANMIFITVRKIHILLHTYRSGRNVQKMLALRDIEFGCS